MANTHDFSSVRQDSPVVRQDSPVVRQDFYAIRPVGGYDPETEMGPLNSSLPPLYAIDVYRHRDAPTPYITLPTHTSYKSAEAEVNRRLA